jgi:rhodanese-related sulfurtransferase
MSIAELTPRQAVADLARLRVIDVRGECEFDGPLGHIGGAELRPLGSLEANAEGLLGDQSLLLVCRSGGRSLEACGRLQQLGANRLANLTGGMIAWNLARLPIARSEPASLPALVEQICFWVAQVGPLTLGAARDIVRERFRRQHVDYDAPTRTAVAELIEFVAECMETVDPPDLELSLSAFRRSLEGL